MRNHTLALALPAVLVLMLMGAAPAGRCGSESGRTSAPPAPAAAPEPDVFTASIRPMLATKCAPCHNPGGKMYARLPFDDPAVVASHKEGVLKRLKEPADRKSYEEWAAGFLASR